MKQTSNDLITGTDSELSEYNGSVMSGIHFFFSFFFLQLKAEVQIREI